MLRRRLCLWCRRRGVLRCCAALSWWSDVVWLIPFERDLSLLKGFRCGSYLITSWRDSVCVTQGSLRQHQVCDTLDVLSCTRATLMHKKRQQSKIHKQIKKPNTKKIIKEKKRSNKVEKSQKTVSKILTKKHQDSIFKNKTKQN